MTSQQVTTATGKDWSDLTQLSVVECVTLAMVELHDRRPLHAGVSTQAVEKHQYSFQQACSSGKRYL